MKLLILAAVIGLSCVAHAQVRNVSVNTAGALVAPTATQFRNANGIAPTNGPVVSGAQLNGETQIGGTLKYPLTLLSGTGGANTNFTLTSGQHVVINSSTNVSFRAMYGTSDSAEEPFSITLTNGSGANWTVEFSNVTNAWHFPYSQGVPTVVTNNTTLRIKGDAIGTNIYAAWAAYVFP